VEPNVDPLLVERLNELGLTVQKELLAKGLTGIVNRTLFDAWSPSRAYPHYHGGVRFLLEIASCRQASPVERKGLDRRATTRPDLNPAPWKGERWALADVVRYHNETALAVLRHASTNPATWLSSFHEVFRKACSGTGGPAAFVIPAAPGPRREREKLLEILSRGGLECRVASETKIGGRFVGHPTVVIPAGQPFFGFAKSVLQNVPYPSPAESGQKPYDTTAHALPLLLGVEVFAVDEVPPTDPRIGVADPSLVSEPWQCGEGSPQSLWPEIGPSDIAVYRPFVTNVMDEGWTRLLLDQEFFDGFKTPYRSVTDHDFARGALGPKVLILPSLSADMILNGNRANEWPPDYRGGIGEAGARWIDRFVRDGGTLIALKDATALPIQLFRLPIKNALTDLTPGNAANIPGAILTVDLIEDHAVTRRLGASVPALFDGGKAFDPDDHPDVDRTLKPVVVGRWGPPERLKLAGYAEGLHLIAGKPAIVLCDVGKGRVILFGFSPQFRCQTFATFPLLRQAILSGLRAD
jgi:hypothetical protein